MVWERRTRRVSKLVALAGIAAVVASTPAARNDALAGSTRARTPHVEVSPEEARARVDATDATSADTVPIAELVAAAAPGERAIVPPPAVFDAPAPPPAPPPKELRAANAAPRTGGVWAVMIGIDDYPGSRSDLRASVADANDVDAALAAYQVPPDRRLVIRNAQGSAATIRAALQWLVDRASSEATAVFFYAGHVRKVGSGREAMVGADGRLVTDAEMAAILRPLEAKRAWIALAACYAGGFTEVLAPGRILTGAADARHLAYENSSYGRSYLVEFMVRRAMLQGRAASSVEHAFAWAADELRREHPDRMPVQYDSHAGDLALGPPPPPPAPASPSAPPPSDQPGEPQPTNPSEPPKDDDPCLLEFDTLFGCPDH